MLGLALGADPAAPLRVLCLGAHSDDIEIGCGGLLLTLAARRRALAVRCVVFSGGDDRTAEARASIGDLLGQAAVVEPHAFADGLFAHRAPAIKAVFEAIKREAAPDLILTHHVGDLHQDHALIGTMTRNTFRDHLILGYEVPKYDADLHPTNAYLPLSAQVAERKAAHIHASFPSQQGRRWFRPETFLSLARLRGIECNAPEGFAEGYHVPKAVLAV